MPDPTPPPADPSAAAPDPSPIDIQPSPEPQDLVPQPEPEGMLLREFLGAEHYDTSQFEDDEALGAHVASQLKAAEQIPQLQQAARYVEYLAPYADQIQEVIRQQQAGDKTPAQPVAQPTAEPEPEPKPYWKPPPQWDPAMEAGLKLDEASGAYTARPGYHPDLPRQYQAYRDWERTQAALLLRDPAAVVREGLAPDFRAAETRQREIVKEELAAYQETQAANAFVLDNQHWLYQQDPQSNRLVIDPQTGSPVLSPQGMQFQQVASQLQAAGTAPAQIPYLAMQMVASAQAPSAGPDQTTPPPSSGAPVPPVSSSGTPVAALQPLPGTVPVPVGEQMKDRFIQGGAYTPGRDGRSVATAAQPHAPNVGPDEDIHTMLKRDMEQAGISEIP